MDEIKTLTKNKADQISTQRTFNLTLIQKDFHATAIIYLLRDVKGLYFKGGTAMHKTFLDYARLSEDVDYTLTEEISKIRKEITEILEQSGLFHQITKDKDVDGFLRLVAHYKKFSGEDDHVFIDLNSRAKLSLPPETHEIKHFYKEEIPKFKVKTLAMDEMIAEKMAATIGRNKPRDLSTCTR